MPLVVAIVIGAAIFFGIKGYVKFRQKSIEAEIGEGICAQCGENIVNKKCPVCDASSDQEKS